MKKFVLPVGAGVVVFGVVTAFAASLTVNSDTLAAGNGTVDRCNASADVHYTTEAGAGFFQVDTASVVSAATCNGLDFRVMLLDASDNVLATSATDQLDVDGNGSADFSADTVDVEDVASVSVEITG